MHHGSEWDLTSRESLLAYCQKAGIDVDFAQQKSKPPYSMDANALHISYEGSELEDPWCEPDKDMWRITSSLESTPNTPEYIEIGFTRGDATSINGESLSAAFLLEKLNTIGGKHGIGRKDIVENRYVGMKSRGCYETPGGSILLKAHRALESITIDREVCHLKDELMPRYASMIYNGYWFAPEREMLQQAIDASQTNVTGVVRIKLYKGNIIIAGRKAEKSLFDSNIATFDDDGGCYNQKDAEGFIRLNALRLAIAAKRF